MVLEMNGLRRTSDSHASSKIYSSAADALLICLYLHKKKLIHECPANSLKFDIVFVLLALEWRSAGYVHIFQAMPQSLQIRSICMMETNASSRCMSSRCI